jgi:hypothetical protein
VATPDHDREPSEPEWLDAPLGDLPAWWGQALDTAELEQLGGKWPDFDLVEFANELAIEPEDGLQHFARHTPPTCRYLVCHRLSLTVWAGVYVAVDMAAGRPVVLKISRRRVESEGRIAAPHDHPNVVKVLDLFVHAGHPTMVLEWCTSTLWLYAKVHAWHEVLARIIEAGRGLAHLHAHGFVHADIKPTNILVHHRTGKLSDFGLACRETHTGPLYGTIGYAAPERDTGAMLFAGDVYSLAITIERALDRASAPGEVPEAVRLLVAAAAADHPEDRPPLVPWLDALEREAKRAQADAQHERDVGSEAVLIAELRKRRRPRRRWTWLQTAVMVAIVVLGVGGTVAMAVCAPDESPVDGALELARKGAKGGDPQFVTQSLELAHSQALRDRDNDELRRVAVEAIEIGEALDARGYRDRAYWCWALASDIYRELGDVAGLHSVPKPAPTD